MKYPFYQIDAFAEKIFEGNPAGVVPLEEWLADKTMQAIAEENNLADTAFFVKKNNGYTIRWFTPTKEVNLCGHATLAAAFVLFNFLDYKKDIIEFDSLSGPLSVKKTDQLLTLNFPSQPPEVCEAPIELIKGLGKTPTQCLKHMDYIAVFDSEDEVLNITPNHYFLEQLDLRGVIITAPSEKYDFVVRFFAPKYAIAEDPVTGSAYTQLTPYWSNRLGKNKLYAKQLSARGGKVYCELLGDRVLISGNAIKYMDGTIEL